MITNKEVFTVYGLIIGMLRAEQNSGRSRLPAREWYRHWHDHPDIVKAREIYLKEAKRASKL